MTHSSVADCGRFAEDSRATAFPPLPPPPDVRNRTRKDLISRALKYVPPHRKQISRRQFLVLFFFFFFCFFAFCSAYYTPISCARLRLVAGQRASSQAAAKTRPRSCILCGMPTVRAPRPTVPLRAFHCSGPGFPRLKLRCDRKARLPYFTMDVGC